MKLLERLRRLFSNRRNVLQTRGGTVRLAGRSLHAHWIVGRDLCMYRREDFANVPRSKRRSALALKLPVWSPFERAGHYCVWAGSSAMVWFWDEDKVGAGSDVSEVPDAPDVPPFGTSVLAAPPSGTAVPGAPPSGAAVPGAPRSGAAVPGASPSGAAVPGAPRSGAAVPGASPSGAAVPGTPPSGAAVPGAQPSATSVPGAPPSATSVPGAPPSAAPVPAATGLRVLPETVFQPRKPDGLHLQRCREGFELQYWRSDVLADAFWFPDRPDRRKLRWFIDRQAGGAQALQSSKLGVAGGELSPDPWRVPLAPGEWIEANERVLVAACLLVLALALAWQETRFWKIRHLAESAAAELALMQDRLEPLLSARGELVRLHRTNRALSAILREPSQARLMGLVDRAIPSAGARFREWHYQQRELKVIVEDPDLDPIAYVRALEAEPLFDQVRAEPVRGDDRIQITLRVRV